MKDQNKHWKTTQMEALKKLQSVINDVSEIRPADSEDEKEEEIWNTIEDLKAMLEDFFNENNQ